MDFKRLVRLLVLSHSSGMHLLLSDLFSVFACVPCPTLTVPAPRKTIEDVLRREHTTSERRRSNLLRQHEDQFSKQCPFIPTFHSSPSFATPSRAGGSRGAPRYANEIAADKAAAMVAAEEAGKAGVAGLGAEEEKAAAGVGEREVVATVES